MPLRNCPVCGTELPENAKFCLECGEKIKSLENEDAEVEPIESEIDNIDVNPIKKYDEKDMTFKTKLRGLASNRITMLKIIIFLIVCIGIGAFSIHSNINYSKGIEAIKTGNYERAVNYFDKSKRPEAESMTKSIGYYEAGASAYEEQRYIDAYENLILIDSAFPPYEDAQKLLNQSKDMIIKGNLQQAKDKYAVGEYVDAYENLKTVLKYDKNQVDALQIQDTYAKKAEEMEERLLKKEIEAEKVRRKSEGVRIGMTQQDVLDSSWGAPNDINRTTTAYGTTEQWCYNGYNYLYFENGILTNIQN